MKNEKTLELLKLVEQNPDLPVVPMVDGEIVSDDYGYYIGNWGSAVVDEYLVAKRNDMIYFKSDDDVFDVLEHQLSDEEFEALPETESECRPFYDGLPWRKAIIVYIRPWEG